MNRPKVVLNPFVYPDLTREKGGCLPNDMRAFACWYYYTIAQKAKEMIGEHTEDQFGLLEGQLWMDKRYENQARAVATLYGLESPDEFLKFFEVVAQQAAADGLPAPAPEYTRPLKPGLILPGRMQ